MKLFRPPLSLACLLLLSVVVAPASGSDALLQMSTISVANDLKLTEGAFRTMTIYQSHKDPTQYYYLPANIRFATNDSGERMFTVYKYNLAYDNANRRYLKPAEQKELDAKLQSNPQLGELYQGGLLKATFSFGLRPGELETMRSALSTFLGSSNFKLGRLPINKASFTFELVDPEDSTGQGKVILGPFTAPVSDDVISVLTPLSRSATDVLSAIVKSGTADAPVNVVLAMSYSGYDVPWSVKVTGSWDKLFTSSQVRSELSGGWWIFKTQASYEDFRQDMKTAASIEITFDGEPPQAEKKKIDEFKDRVVDEILKSIMDKTTVQPAADVQKLDSDAGKAPAELLSELLMGYKASVGVGFAMKAVKMQDTGTMDFKQQGYTMITVADVRYPKLNFGVEPGKLNRHYLEIEPSSWETASPSAEVSADLDKWFSSHTVTLAFPINGVLSPREWKPAPGQTWNFGPFNLGSNTSPVMPVTYQCIFTIDRAKLNASGITGLDTKLARESLEVASRAYQEIYGNTVVVPYENDYSRVPAVLISKNAIPLGEPEPKSIIFYVKGPTGYADYASAEGQRGGIAIENITLHPNITASIPVRSGGMLQNVTKEAPSTIVVDSFFSPTQRRYTKQYDNIFILPAAQCTIDYTIVVETEDDDEDEVTYRKTVSSQPYVPGTVIDVHLTNKSLATDFVKVAE